MCRLVRMSAYMIHVYMCVCHEREIVSCYISKLPLGAVGFSEPACLFRRLKGTSSAVLTLYWTIAVAGMAGARMPAMFVGLDPSGKQVLLHW